MRVFLYVCCLSVLFLPISAFSDTICGKVVTVLDGDTITLMTEQGEKVKVRLYGVDTPKDDQPHCQKAKRFTFALMHDKEVEVIPYAKDLDGKTVGIVHVNSMNANEELIRSGHGWQSRAYCQASFCEEWLRLENDAKVSGVGLWREENPVPPWEWRAEQQDDISVANSGAM